MWFDFSWSQDTWLIMFQIFIGEGAPTAGYVFTQFLTRIVYRVEFSHGHGCGRDQQGHKLHSAVQTRNWVRGCCLQALIWFFSFYVLGVGVLFTNLFVGASGLA